MEWSNDDCLQLIDIYSEHPLLWDPKHPYHYSKNKKNEAWASISSTLGREEKGVRQKMTSLLGSFRSQRSKGKKSIGTGKGAVEVYVSKWFAFDRMRFLLDKDEPNNTIDSQSAVLDLTNLESQQADIIPTEEEQSTDDVLHLDTIMPEPTNTPAETPRTSSIKRKRNQEDPRIDEAFKILKKANKNMEESSKQDMLDFYGLYIVSKMKKYSAQTQLTVEHEINKILYHADMGFYDGQVEIISHNE
ncbi:unnamed protein product [Larinioides sclopetarius]|uniref:MADF domain-containing protein n=1 Tax=Larinioides sclopetarius TaxID=280406 RepID=A0AAV1Z802_9ARAC